MFQNVTFNKGNGSEFYALFYRTCLQNQAHKDSYANKSQLSTIIYSLIFSNYMSVTNMRKLFYIFLREYTFPKCIVWYFYILHLPLSYHIADHPPPHKKNAILLTHRSFSCISLFTILKDKFPDLREICILCHNTVQWAPPPPTFENLIWAPCRVGVILDTNQNQLCLTIFNVKPNTKFKWNPVSDFRGKTCNWKETATHCVHFINFV
jgi:hypothetical protein